MTVTEVKAKFDEIVAFAEIERFLDTPVKRYSSGMYVRLAFAVAAHLEPEILIVDEVLAVGDVEFQRKCLGRMRSVSSKEGRTVLFVSHNMTAINSLCDRAILMNGGRPEKIGPTLAITQHYIRSGGSAEERGRSWTYQDAPGDERFKITRIEITPDGTDATAPIQMGTGFQVETEYWNLVDNGHVMLELLVRGDDGTPVFHSYSTEGGENFIRPHPRGRYRSSCRVPGDLLNTGRFGIEMYFSDGRQSKEFGLVDAVSVVVHELNGRHDLTPYGRFVGHVHPKLTWRTVPLAAGEGVP